MYVLQNLNPIYSVCVGFNIVYIEYFCNLFGILLSSNQNNKRGELIE